HLADVTIQVLDTVQHHTNGLLREAGLQRNGVAGENVAARVRSPEQKGTLTEPQKLAHQRKAFSGLVHVDVRTLVMRVDAETDRIGAGHADHNLEAFRVRESLGQDTGKEKRLRIARTKNDVHDRAVAFEQFPELLPRGDAGLLTSRLLGQGRRTDDHAQQCEQGHTLQKDFSHPHLRRTAPFEETISHGPALPDLKTLRLCQKVTWRTESGQRGREKASCNYPSNRS